MIASSTPTGRILNWSFHDGPRLSSKGQNPILKKGCPVPTLRLPPSSGWSAGGRADSLVRVPEPRARTVSFRTLLTGALLLLLGITMAVLVTLSTTFGNRNFRDLTHTIAEQTLAHAEARVQAFLQKAVDLCRQVGNELGPRVMGPTNFPAVGQSLAESLQAQPTLARLTYVLEPSGEFVQTERSLDGQIWIREGWRTDSNRLTVRSWNWARTNRTELQVTNLPADVMLSEAGFNDARNRGRPAWTHAYSWTEGGNQLRWAVRYSAPVLGADGRIKAFIGASLTLDELNRYLRQLDVLVPGYVAIVEEDRGPQPRLLGHPNRSLVGRQVVINAPAEPVIAGYVRALFSDPRFASGELALADYGRAFSVGSTNFLGSFLRLQGTDDPRWILLMLMPLSEVAGGVQQNLRWATASAVAFLLIATLAALALARRIAQPMRQLSDDARALSQLQFEPHPRPLSSIREVRQLEQSLDDARASLRSFRKYVPAEVVNQLVTSGAEAVLGGQNTRLTVLFSDVVDFTAMAETVPAQDLVVHLGEYLAAVSTLIQQGHGTVDKFIGDGVMAFWGAPLPNSRHALDACVTAWRLQSKLDELNARWQAAGDLTFRTRIGINTGQVIVGNIGSEVRMNYTAMGDPVNVAARLESLNRAFGTRILISEETRMAAGDDLLTRPVTRVAVKGSQRGVVVHELLGLEAETAPEAPARRLADLTRSAFHACEQGRWEESLEFYDTLLREFPEDGVARAQRELIQENRQMLRTSDSELIRRMTSK